MVFAISHSSYSNYFVLKHNITSVKSERILDFPPYSICLWSGKRFYGPCVDRRTVSLRMKRCEFVSCNENETLCYVVL